MTLSYLDSLPRRERKWLLWRFAISDGLMLIESGAGVQGKLNAGTLGNSNGAAGKDFKATEVMCNPIPLILEIDSRNRVD